MVIRAPWSMKLMRAAIAKFNCPPGLHANSLIRPKLDTYPRYLSIVFKVFQDEYVMKNQFACVVNSCVSFLHARITAVEVLSS